MFNKQLIFRPITIKFNLNFQHVTVAIALAAVWFLTCRENYFFLQIIIKPAGAMITCGECGFRTHLLTIYLSFDRNFQQQLQQNHLHKYGIKQQATIKEDILISKSVSCFNPLKNL